jgi:hypothetical protein
VTSRIAGRIVQAPAGRPQCTDVISGDAGILLALIADDSDAAVRAAHVLAGRLAEAAEPGSDGLHWRMAADREYLMPGFSHGTAGVAYALAAAGRTLNRRDLVDVATRGAGALLALGHHPGGWAVPHAIPPQPGGPAVAYGWCHGPAGTVRLFLLLNEIDPQPRWQHAIDACLQALRDSRLPIRLYPGYWDNLARCCGTAGVGQLLLDRYQATGDTALLDWAGTLAADVAGRALFTPRGVTWSNTEHTRIPPGTAPRTRVHAGRRRNRRLAGQTPRPSHPARYPTRPDRPQPRPQPIMALTAHNPVHVGCIPIRRSRASNDRIYRDGVRSWSMRHPGRHSRSGHRKIQLAYARSGFTISHQHSVRSHTRTRRSGRMAVPRRSSADERRSGFLARSRAPAGAADLKQLRHRTRARRPHRGALKY